MRNARAPVDMSRAATAAESAMRLSDECGPRSIVVGRGCRQGIAVSIRRDEPELAEARNRCVFGLLAGRRPE
jgi:hypothetical protein